MMLMQISRKQQLRWRQGKVWLPPDPIDFI
jgi:hypothetical protein